MMRDPIAHKQVGPEIAAAAAALLVGVLALPQSRAQSKPEAPAFEVASVRPAAPPSSGKFQVSLGSQPGRVNYRLVTVRDLLQRAYGLRRQQVAGPDWIDNDRFDIVAKLPEGASNEQVPVMLQNLLTERFQLTVRREKKEMPVYALVVGKNGPKLEQASGDADPGSNQRRGVMITDAKLPGLARIEGHQTTLANFANMLSGILDRVVVDQTELAGTYNFAFEAAIGDFFMKKLGAARMGVAPEEKSGEGAERGPAPDSSPSGSILSDIQKIGLRLEPRKAALDFIVVEKGNRVPTEN
jgi:uncharacterized protein (TIGR03435 family)